MQWEAWSQATDNLPKAAVNILLVVIIILIKLQIEMQVLCTIFLSDQGFLKEGERKEKFKTWSGIEN